ncbi:hypothetical protein CTA2_2992 [Colletotrichum tanaceti]|uniref:Ubiquitin-like protease family profile domain-containing protein n=1 Tax=Colletotrichum tanaceti TaxID=1306861 RepID=A0A4U6XW10_9PEZI|nr:hypothetical protein CTA2_2992 [Colletotrichum tanaceti]TKW60069.1 hypothetical protein CTA1_3112 [Colletotrichum tanaceti]
MSSMLQSRRSASPVPVPEHEARLRQTLETLNSLGQTTTDTAIARLWHQLELDFYAFAPASASAVTSAPSTPAAASPPAPSSPTSSFQSWALRNVDRQILGLATDGQHLHHLTSKANGTTNGKGTKGSGGRDSRLNAVARKYDASPGIFCFLFGTDLFPSCRPALDALTRLHASHPDYNIMTLFAAYENVPKHETVGKSTTRSITHKNRLKKCIESLDPNAWHTRKGKKGTTSRRDKTSLSSPPPIADNHPPSDQETSEDADSSDGEPCEASNQYSPLPGPVLVRSADDADVSADGRKTHGWESDEDDPEQERNCLSHGLSTVFEDGESHLDLFPTSPLNTERRSRHHKPRITSGSPSPGFDSHPPSETKKPHETPPLTARGPWQFNNDSFQFNIMPAEPHDTDDENLTNKRRSLPAVDPGRAAKQRRFSVDKSGAKTVDRQHEALAVPGPVFEGATSAGVPAGGNEVGVGPLGPSEPINQGKSYASRPSLESLIAACPRLAPKQWLNDVVINTLMGRLAGPATAPLDSFTVESKLTDRRSLQLRKVIQGKEIVMIPVNEGGNHWVLYVFKQSDASLTRYDSLRCSSAPAPAPSRGSTCRNVSRLLGAVLELSAEKPLTAHWSLDCPQQDNTWDCGLHVLWCARMVAARLPVDGAVVLDRICLRHELCTSSAASIPPELLHEAWMPMFRDPSCLALRTRWLVEYRSRRNKLEELDRPGYFQRDAVRTMLQNDSRYTRQGAVVALISRLHELHWTHLCAAIDANRLYREDQKRVEEDLAKYRNAIRLISQRPSPPLLRATLSEGQRQVFASFASMAGAVSTMLEEKQPTPHGADDDDSVDDQHDGYKNGNDRGGDDYNGSNVRKWYRNSTHRYRRE